MPKPHRGSHQSTEPPAGRLSPDFGRKAHFWEHVPSNPCVTRASQSKHLAWEIPPVLPKYFRWHLLHQHGISPWGLAAGSDGSLPVVPQLLWRPVGGDGGEREDAGRAQSFPESGTADLMAADWKADVNWQLRSLGKASQARSLLRLNICQGDSWPPCVKNRTAGRRGKSKHRRLKTP